MRRFRLAMLTLVSVIVAVPVLALPHTTQTERDQNRAKLQQFRDQDPAQLAHLYQQAQAFLALAPERSAQLRQLDQDLHQLPIGQRKHLKQVLKKYVAWFNQLPAAQRQAIEQAPNAETRLELIKQVREEQWIANLPKTRREELAMLEGEARTKFITDLKKQQWRWHVEWQLAFDHWDALMQAKLKPKSQQMPESFEHLPGETKNYVQTYLLPMLTPAARQELESAQGNWPWFPYLLVKLADENPLALPSAAQWPQRLADLPKEIKDRLNKGNPQADSLLKPLEGKYRDFVAKAAQLLERKNPPLKYELWPARYDQLSPAVRAFVENELRPLLIPKDLTALQDSEGQWPDYPETMQKLAVKYYLVVPWQSLPPPARWDSYRLRKGFGSDEG